jgi:hypothetical protein
MSDKKQQKKELSEYWKQRARRRAKMNGRRYPNKLDQEWASEQQTYSLELEGAFERLEQEMNEAEEGLAEAKAKVKQFGPKVKSAKNPYSGQTQGKKNFPFDDPSRLGRTRAFQKRAKKVPAVAPGEAFGPMEEQSPLSGPSPVSTTTSSQATSMADKSPDQAKAEANAAIAKAKGVIDSATRTLNQIVGSLTAIK